MASAYGIIHNYGEPQSTFDSNLALKALEYKQNKYDANMVKMEQVMTQYGMQINQIKNPKAQEYFYNRLNGLVNNIEGLRGADFSSNEVTQGIVGHINQALDPTVIKHLNYGRQIDNYIATAQQYKKEGKGGYSDTNFQYGLSQAGYMNYVNGDVDAELGNLNYTPYQDVQKKYIDMFDEMDAVKKGVTKKVPHPDYPGYFVEKTTKGLSENEIRNNVFNSLTPDEQKQLQINAWASSQGQDVYGKYVAPKIKSYQQKIDQLKLNYEGKTQGQKAIIDNQVSQYNNAIKYLTQKKDNPQAMQSFVGREQLVNGLSSMYGKRVTNEEWSSDATALKTLEQQQKQINSSIGLDQNRTGTLDVTSISIETETEQDEINLRERADNEFRRNRETLGNLANQAYNRLDSDKKKQFDSAYKAYLEENDLVDNEANRATFTIEQSNGGKGDLMTVSEIKQGKQIIRTFKNQLKARNEGAKNLLRDKRNGVIDNRFIDELRNNPNIKITDEQGNVVSASKYLRGKTAENLSETQKTALLKSVFTDIALSQTKDYSPTSREGVNATNNFNINRLAEVNNELDSTNLPMLVNPQDIIYSAYDSERKEVDFEGLKRDMQLPSQMTKQQFEENIEPLVESKPNYEGGMFSGFAELTGLDELSEKVGANLFRSLGVRSIEDNLIIGGEGTQTRADLEKGIANGTYDKAFPNPFVDDSVEDDADLRGMLNYREEFENEYAGYITTQTGKFAQNKQIIVEPSGRREGETVPAYEDILNLTAGQTTFDKGERITLVENETGDGYIATQLDATTVIDDGEEELKTKQRTAVINKVDVQGRALGDWIKENQTSEAITVDNTTEPIYSDEITFATQNNSDKYLGDINNTFYGGQRNRAQLSHLTSQGAKERINQKHSDLMNDPEYGQLFRELINRTIDNSHIFRLKLEPSTFGTFDVKIGYEQEGTFQVLQSMDTGRRDVTDVMGQFDTMPQQFFYEYLDRLMTDIELNGVQNKAEQINTLTKLLN